MRNRGHATLLFGPADDVGIAYWSARGLPGTWAEHLNSGEWRTTPYEALAESFAALNLSDAERTETYGVALDRGAILAFFVSLASPTR